MPDEPSCLSTTQAYQVTNTAITEAPPESSQSSEPTTSLALVPPLQQPMPKIDDPTPIRTPSKVMRIWVAPWEDADGDLNVSGFVFTELEQRRWMIGKSAPTQSPSISPLQVLHRSKENDRPPRAPSDDGQHNPFSPSDAKPDGMGH